MKDLNLIPKSYILEKRKKSKKLYITVGIMMTSIILALSIALPIYIKHNLEAQKSENLLKVNSVAVYKDGVEKLDALKDKYSQREKEANSLTKYGVSMTTVIENIEKALPDKLFIISLGVSGESKGIVQISITGVCESDDDVASFINHLRNGNYFSNIVISSIKRNVISQPNQLGLAAIIAKSSNSNSSTGKSKDQNTNSGTQAVSPQQNVNYNFNMSLYLKFKD